MQQVKQMPCRSWGDKYCCSRTCIFVVMVMVVDVVVVELVVVVEHDHTGTGLLILAVLHTPKFFCVFL